MPSCPICNTEAHEQRAGTPYWVCPSCALWFQSPLPPKVYSDDWDTPMPEAERQINMELARRLHRDYLGGKPGVTLDVGCGREAVLVNALAALGCRAYGSEGDPRFESTGKLNLFGLDIEDAIPAVGQFDLITCIHSFEHLYDPMWMLARFSDFLNDDGALFIRMPDHGVAGWERHVKPDIHPYFYSRTSLLQLLSELEGAFVLSDYYALGAGQSDFVLRPIKKKPIIALGGIAKNELRDLPRMIKSASGAYDRQILIDTGSSDGTEKMCRQVFTEANDEQGRLTDFSKARNRYLDLADQEADWVLTLDADDELMTPAAVRRTSYWTQFDAYSFTIQDGSSKWYTHRFWKTNMGLRYEGRCHEYPNKIQAKDATVGDVLIIHHGNPSPNQENSNARNLRILNMEWDEKPSARCAFYLANTYRDAQLWKEAASWYMKRIEMGEHYRDEWLFAHLYMARCLRRVGSIDAAMQCLQAARATQPDWCEFTMELAFIAYDDKRYTDAIEIALTCLNKTIPLTNLWREPWAYTDAPARLISWSHEHLGNFDQALAWSDLAKSLIGHPDEEWNRRHDHLRSVVIIQPKITRRKPMLVLDRPGAIGDILMTLNLVPLLKKKYPDHEVVYQCHKDFAHDIQLGGIIKAAGCDRVTGAAELGPTLYRALIGYPLREGYPDKPMRQHLMRYFAEEMGLELNGKLPSLSLKKDWVVCGIEGPYATLQRHSGWSDYKQWPDERWDEVVKRLRNQGIAVVEINAKLGLSLQTVIELFSRAKMHLGIDSFCNHLTHYLWDGKRVPGVILWGSTAPHEFGYEHNINIWKHPPCSPCHIETSPHSVYPKRVCEYNHRCMQEISVDEVVEAALRLWEEQDSGSRQSLS